MIVLSPGSTTAEGNESNYANCAFSVGFVGLKLASAVLLPLLPSWDKQSGGRGKIESC